MVVLPITTEYRGISQVAKLVDAQVSGVIPNGKDEYLILQVQTLSWLQKNKSLSYGLKAYNLVCK